MKAYEGNEKYIFISYAHKDSNTVLPTVASMQKEGFRIWFDEGIEAGTEWPEYIAEHLSACAVVLVFMTNNTANSQNCRNEINFALSLGKEVLIVYLEETNLTPGMQLQIGSLQSMFRYRHKTEETFLEELMAARILKECKGDCVKCDAAFGNKDGKIVYADGREEILPYGIVKIAGDAYKGNHDIVSVVLPNSVKAIKGDSFFAGAFFDCINLKSVTIPESVNEIGSNSFNGCKSLESIVIPSSVREIGERAFRGCSLKNVIIPNGVREIGERAFEDCKNLTSFTISNSVFELGNGVLSGCIRLAEINIPDNVASIMGNPFTECNLKINVSNKNKYFKVIGNTLYTIDGKTLIAHVPAPSETEFKIPAGVEEISIGAFASCGYLTAIEIPDSVREIGREAFRECANITKIRIPEGITEIRAHTFDGCIRLTEANIPEGVTSIEMCAFYGCLNLASITIPKSMTHIYGCVFSECPRLKNIYYKGSASDWKKINIDKISNFKLTGNIFKRAKIHYNCK